MDILEHGHGLQFENKFGCSKLGAHTPGICLFGGQSPPSVRMSKVKKTSQTKKRKPPPAIMKEKEPLENKQTFTVNYYY
jgi:hypothetical protein